jgi:serpin B
MTLLHALDYRPISARIGLALLSGLLAACSSAPDTPNTPSAEPDPEPAAKRQERVVRAVTPELEPALAANDRLAWALYAKLREPGQNAFFSPFSVSAALTMTYAGARAETRDEMRALLGVSGDDASHHAAFGALFSDLAGDRGRGYTLHLANRLFPQVSYPFDAGFLELLSSAYGAAPQAVDYGDSEGARQTVNTWVSEQTAGKLPELVAPGVFDGTTRLCLVNAIYFQADWLTAFDPRKTEDAPFYLEEGGEKRVPMMRQGGRFRVGGDDTFAALELPYADDELAMLIVLPRAARGLASVESELDGERVQSLARSLSEKTVTLSVPRFELRSEPDLVPALKSSGMQAAFDPDRADFSGMLAPGQPQRESLYVKTLLHQGFLSVDEHGTTAAAASAVVVATRSATPEFRVDHPFVFVIRDKLTSATLFVGRIADPG